VSVAADDDIGAASGEQRPEVLIAPHGAGRRCLYAALAYLSPRATDRARLLAVVEASSLAAALRDSDPAVVGAYELVGRLGGGGQGVVYLARGPAGALVALKLLDVTTDNPGIRARFLKEVAAGQRVPRFCTAQVLDAGISDHRPYIVSEFIEGRSLEEMVRDTGACSRVALERVAVATATALGGIHSAGVIHRDFKPGNVILGGQGPVVIDFGIAAVPGMTTTRVSGQVLAGTPAFMAPEHLSAQAVTSAADMWSWAVTIIYAATGALPFTGRGAALAYQIVHGVPVIGDLPRPLRSLVGACLSKNPAQRPSAREVVQALVGAGIAAPGPIPAAPVGTPIAQVPPAGVSRRRQRLGLTRRRVLAAGLVCSSAAGLGGLAWEINSRRTPRGPGRARSHPTRAGPGPGTPIWQAELPFEVDKLAVGGGVVCATEFGQVSALRASDGAQLWTFKGITNGVAVTHDTVYVPVVPGTQTGPYAIYALRLADGSTIWKIPLLGGGIAATSRMVYVGVEQTVITLRAFRASDGTQAWEFPATVLYNPVVNRNVVYTLSDITSSMLYAIDGSNGALIWRAPALPPGSSQIVTGGNTICALGSTEPSALWVWRANDGKILWKSDADGGYVYAAIAGNVIYAVNDTSELVALDASDGTKLWGFPVDDSISPTISGHLIYAGSAGGGLVALRTSNGKPVWQSPIYFTEGPVVGASALYVSDGHTVHALRM
jgi:outer membrane protein assembly factor BamB/predicted Ser/Thr protein kinase